MGPSETFLITKKNLERSLYRTSSGPVTAACKPLTTSPQLESGIFDRSISIAIILDQVNPHVSAITKANFKILIITNKLRLKSLRNLKTHRHEFHRLPDEDPFLLENYITANVLREAVIESKKF